MSFIVQIENNSQGKELIKYLSTLNFVKVYEKSDHKTIPVDEKTNLYSLNGKQLDVKEFNRILQEAEDSPGINLDDALAMSEEWKENNCLN